MTKNIFTALTLGLTVLALSSVNTVLAQTPPDSLVVDNTGDVGMGTATPTEEFHIIRVDADDVFVRLESNDSTPINTGFQFRNGNGAHIWNNFNNAAGDFVYSKAGLGAVMVLDGATGDVRIPGGNCSDLSGGGGCTPDYVFEEDYDLPTLTELAVFIKENKHLPNVPSAADNENNGINLRGLNFAMLEKIEELVLYTIEQQETIVGQQETIDTLMSRVEAIEQQRK